MTATDHTVPANLRASRTVASVWGVFAGFGGLIHGIGEVSQGNVPAESIFIPSWTQGPIAEYMGGDPGLTIVPNLLVTGILTIVVSLTLILWSALFVQRKNGGRILIFLSLGMLSVGGGVGPPFVGILAGWAGTGIHSRLKGWRAFPPVLRNLLIIARLWPWLGIACFIATALLFVGSLIMVYVFAFGNADFFLYLFYFVSVSLLLTVIAGFMHDIRG